MGRLDAQAYSPTSHTCSCAAFNEEGFVWSVWGQASVTVVAEDLLKRQEKCIRKCRDVCASSLSLSFSLSLALSLSLSLLSDCFNVKLRFRDSRHA